MTGVGPHGSDPVRTRAVVAGLAVGACLTWNVSNVGAVADPLADAYGVSLPAIGLLTTALFVTHLLVQLPAGRGADRYGARAVALAAVAVTLLGSGVLVLDDSFGLALLGRALVGLGSGAGFVAGFDLVRAGGGGAVYQGLYGGATMVGGGLALAVVPALSEATGWRAPYWSAALLAVLAALPLALAADLPRVGHGAARVLRDLRLVPLGVLQASTFGLAVIAGNWAVPLLERRGAGAAAAGALAGLVLFAGIVTRPAGGWLAARFSQRGIVLAALAGVTAGAALLALDGPLWLAGLGAGAFGLGAGLPFAVVFAAAQHARPDAPAAAVSVVNAAAVSAILVGTPLAGLAFHLPGDGSVAFAGMALAAAAALPVARRAALRGR